MTKTSTGSNIDGSEIIIGNDTIQRRFCVEVNGQRVVETLRQGTNKAIQVPNGKNLIRITFTDGKHTRSALNWVHTNNERVVITALAGLNYAKLEVISRTALHHPAQQRVHKPASENSLKTEAIASVFNTLSRPIPDGSKIAVANIAHGNSNAAFVQEQLTFLFVNSQRFSVIDSQSFDTVKTEQGFQLAGEIKNETAASIGQFLEADIVIVGNIAGNGSERRLKLRAINTKTAQIIAIAFGEI